MSIGNIVGREKAAQLFTNGEGFDEVCPIKGVKQCSQASSSVVQECGIPEWLVVDNHKSQGVTETCGIDWGKPVEECHVKQTLTQPHCWWQMLRKGSLERLEENQEVCKMASNHPTDLVTPSATCLRNQAKNRVKCSFDDGEDWV